MSCNHFGVSCSISRNHSSRSFHVINGSDSKNATDFYSVSHSFLSRTEQEIDWREGTRRRRWSCSTIIILIVELECCLQCIAFRSEWSSSCEIVSLRKKKQEKGHHGDCSRWRHEPLCSILLCKRRSYSLALPSFETEKNWLSNQMRRKTTTTQEPNTERHDWQAKYLFSSHSLFDFDLDSDSVVLFFFEAREKNTRDEYSGDTVSIQDIRIRFFPWISFSFVDANLVFVWIGFSEEEEDTSMMTKRRRESLFALQELEESSKKSIAVVCHVCFLHLPHP